MFRDIPLPQNSHGIRLQIEEEEAAVLAEMASRCQVSLTALCRVIMGMVSRGSLVCEVSIVREIDKFRERTRAEKPPQPPRRPPGRPRKESLPDSRPVKRPTEPRSLADVLS